MEREEFIKLELRIKKEYEIKLYNLRQDFVEANNEFKVGDFIYNVTGIIKIEKIGHESIDGYTTIVYRGYRYRKIKGELLRTKDPKLSSLRYEAKRVKIN